MKKKRYAVTLIEMMIVIMLIGIIGGALAFNMRGSMDQGRAFKTEQNQMRIHDILSLEATKGNYTLEEVVRDWKAFIQCSPLVKDSDELCRDGWKHPFNVDQEDGEIVVHSSKLSDYKKKHEKA